MEKTVIGSLNSVQESFNIFNDKNHIVFQRKYRFQKKIGVQKHEEVENIGESARQQYTKRHLSFLLIT